MDFPQASQVVARNPGSKSFDPIDFAAAEQCGQVVSNFMVMTPNDEANRPSRGRND
jgi:hypothetical protein